MTGAAILFMSVSLIFVVVLISWCYTKILTAPPRDESGQDD